MKMAFKVLNEADKTVILNPQKPLFSLIWLHGLGDSPAGFLDYFMQPQSPLHKGARIKLLHAPIKPVTINGGMKCPSWYDIKILGSQGNGMKEDDRCSLEDVRESLEFVERKVGEEVEFWGKLGVEGDVYRRIFVGGFSQGCAISLLYGLTSKHQLGGVIGLSGYLFDSFPKPNTGKIPILLHHGLYDPMIPYKQALASYKPILKTPHLEFKEKEHEHTVTEGQLGEITLWLMKVLKESAVL